MDVPVIDLTPYVDDASGKFSCDELLHPELKKVCSEVSRILRETGALLVRDPRCSTEDNDRFIDMMEKYFEQPEEVKRVQERPNQHYQVVTQNPSVLSMILIFLAVTTMKLMGTKHYKFIDPVTLLICI
ncbi:putative non-heme dioxygenase domain, isopenicillin N synthase [Helianthus annuus]|nr:putative non-heme dioxygenase domain, isopenicillin N synthase [Helianthus annuus]